MKHAIAETTMEIEHLAVVFDEKIKEIHALYQENFENERNRLNQYRDFIEFLLTEKTLIEENNKYYLIFCRAKYMA